MITKEMVQAGYTAGVIQLVSEDGIVCKIGDIWFYFGGPTAEETNSVEEFKSWVPEADIVDEIYQTLEAFRVDGNAHEEIGDEYLYYCCYLHEQGIR